MAWHLNDSVVSGFIDNREKNKVRGELLLADRTTPIHLDLNGNCAGDLAGCLVEFKNPNVKPAEPLPAFPDQIGEAGEITGSRRIWNIPAEIDPGTLTREEIRKFGQINVLYLDWFSETNGFVVVEIIDPEIKISEANFSHEELPRLPFAAPCMFVHKIDMEQFGGSGKPLDEFGYEKMLQQFDERVRRFEELSERYKDDPDGDQKIAKELDFTIITDDPDDDDEDFFNDFLDEDSDPEDEPEQHPLVSSAFKLPNRFAEFGAPRMATMMKGNFIKLCESTMEAAVKLENALTPVSNRDPGLIIALLKRALREYHTALEALEKAPKIPPKLRDQWRNEILRIREQILREMSTYRKTAS